MVSSHAPRDGVQSLARALDLLEIVQRAGGHLPIGEIAAGSGIPLPTTHRLLATLVAHGYMRRLPNRRYALGFKLVPLGSTAASLVGLSAEAVLRELVDELGESANLAVLSGKSAEYVAQAPSTHSMRMFTEVGRTVDLHCTGVGKAMLALLPAEKLEAYLSSSELPPRTAHTIVDPLRLRDAIAEVRRVGYALDEQEQELGVRCIAVATATPAPMAVSISGPVTRVTDDIVARAAPLLEAALVRLTRSLAE